MANADIELHQSPLNALDLEPMIKKLVAPVEKGGYDWPEADARSVAEEYRNFLETIRQALQDEAGMEGVSKIAPPTKAVDIFWHTHILFTQKYFDDCETFFGRYLHHQPLV